MPKMVLTAQFLSINATVLNTTGSLSKAELVVEVEDNEVTNYASGGWKEYLGGLRSGSLAVEFFQDYAASAIDSIIWPLLGTVVAFEVRPTTAVVGTSNPKYTGSVLINKWGAVEGSVGDTATSSCDWPTSGAVVRATV